MPYHPPKDPNHFTSLILNPDEVHLIDISLKILNHLYKGNYIEALEEVNTTYRIVSSANEYYNDPAYAYNLNRNLLDKVNKDMSNLTCWCHGNSLEHRGKEPLPTYEEVLAEETQNDRT